MVLWCIIGVEGLKSGFHTAINEQCSLFMGDTDNDLKLGERGALTCNPCDVCNIGLTFQRHLFATTAMIRLENTIIVSNVATVQQPIQPHGKTDALDGIPVFNQLPVHHLPGIDNIQTLGVIAPVFGFHRRVGM